MDRTLTPHEIERYSRQLILKGWSEKLQIKLGQIRVAIPSEMQVLRRYLIAAGITQIYTEHLPDSPLPPCLDYRVELGEPDQLTIYHENTSQSFKIPPPAPLLEAWIATLIISHVRNAPKPIFPVATMLFA